MVKRQAVGLILLERRFPLSTPLHLPQWRGSWAHPGPRAIFLNLNLFPLFKLRGKQWVALHHAGEARSPPLDHLPTLPEPLCGLVPKQTLAQTASGSSLHATDISSYLFHLGLKLSVCLRPQYDQNTWSTKEFGGWQQDPSLRSTEYPL